MVDDVERLESIAMSLGQALKRYGLTPAEFKRETANADGYWTPVATWRGNRPRVGVWLDRFLGGKDRQLWFGFFSGPAAMGKFRNELPRQLGNPVIVKDSDLDDDDESVTTRTLERIRAGGGFSCELYRSDHHYLGKYEIAFDASRDIDLVKEAALFIGDTVEFVDPDLSAEKDIDELKRQNIDATTRRQLINARVGQGQFRADLMMKWNNRCSVSESNIREVLRASHIMPWSKANNAERLDPENGLLLTATLDALFDKGLISFSDDGAMCISSELPKNERLLLLNRDHMKLRSAPSKKQKSYLERHRTSVFRP
jgi:HNH endonuclease